MKNQEALTRLFYVSALALLLPACGGEDKKMEKLQYPVTQKGDQVDVYFNDSVADPYRWLEDDRSPETADWVTRQNEFTFNYLKQIPYRDSIRKRLEVLYDYEKVGAPFREGQNSYYFKNDGLQNQSVMYKINEGGEDEVFFDPNALSTDGTVSLSGLQFTKDGSLMAYSISRGGADWQEIYVMDVKSKALLSDKIMDVKFSGTEWKGNEGFFYSTYKDKSGSKLSAKTENHKLYFHKLGTPVDSDVLVFGDDANPRRYVGASVSEDGKYLIIQAAMATTGNQVYIVDLSKPGYDAMPVIENFENDHDLVFADKGKFYFLTTLNAPNRRLVEVDLANPAPENWKDIIPVSENVLSVSQGAGYFFAKYQKDVLSHVVQYSFSGEKLREVTLPGQGSAGGFGGNVDDKMLYYTFTSYIYPSTVFSYDPASGTSAVYKKPEIDFDPALYESKQVFFTSKDGTKIPMMITHKKGLELNGKNPTLLYGYGGFNISLQPNFSTAVLVLLENGGVYAVPNLRGGGEYGEEWHMAGTKLKKQNVFDDFIAAAEYLIKEKYCSSDYLAISGGSNGGLLVGAVMTQRPDLMRVALPAVGVLDMLRYNAFTAGEGWATDYGTAQESEDMYRYLKGYSPVHNVKAGTAYPATMITTGDHDDRVVPAHSFKFAATLQEGQAGPAPILIRIDVNAGHGAGKPTAKILDEQADKWAFMLWSMGVREL
ncbi:MAG TPA: S9 family peptidase [Bacteroidetes bacterium]|nr:S9 family peptidase [Bacteroidota bacterium]